MSQSVPELGRVCHPLPALYWKHHDDCGQGYLRERRLQADGTAPVAERTEVQVLIPTQSPADDDPTGWAAARALIGFVDDALDDMAEHHDRYLYGRPRA